MINKSLLLLFTIAFSFTSFAQDYTKFQIQRATMFSNYIAEELELNEAEYKVAQQKLADKFGVKMARKMMSLSNDARKKADNK